MVVLLTLELTLKSVDCCRACMALSLILNALSLNLLQLLLQLRFIISKSSDFISLIGSFLSGPHQLLLELSAPVLMHHQLLVYASLVAAELVHGIRRHLYISLQIGAAAFVQIYLLTKSQYIILLGLDVKFKLSD